MKDIGIIVAMKEELIEIAKILEDIRTEQKYDLAFFKGKIHNKNIILVESGVGKVNAARVTQVLIDNYKVDSILNVGAAGALDPNLNIGDIVIAEKLIQHDFDITAFNHNKGYITGVGDYIECDKSLVEDILNSAIDIEDIAFKVEKGIIATGDIFCTEISMKNKIYAKFRAKCVEMEGAAIAQVCYLDKIPFVVIRSISDSPNGNNAVTFDEFVELASKRCADILRRFLQ